MVIRVTSQVLEALRDAASQAHPLEACGILLGHSLGEGAQITHFRASQNVDPNPCTHFGIDPQALIDAHRAERSGGPQVIGYFHSHPRGRAEPSKTDQARAAGDGKIWAIWGEGHVTFWRDEPAGFCEVSYSLEGG